MYMKNLFVLFEISFLLLFASCTMNRLNKDLGVERIEVDLSKVNKKTPLFSSFDFIKLETKDECLLEKVVKVVFSDDYIYLLSSYGGNIYKYSNNGKYISKLRQGNGPGELTFATDFYVDEPHNKLYVLDVYRVIKEYDLSGTFLNEHKLDSSCFLFTRVNDAFLLFDSNLSKKNNFHLRLFNNNSKDKSFCKKNEYLKQIAFMPSNVFSMCGDSKYLFSHMLSDTIYHFEIDEEKLYPAYFIDFGKRSINSIDKQISDAREYDMICKTGNYISGIYSVSYINDKLFFSFMYEMNNLYAFYSSKEKEVFLYNQLYKGLPNTANCVGRNENSVIYSYTVSELKDFFDLNPPIDQEMVKLQKSCENPDENPILVRFSL